MHPYQNPKIKHVGTSPYRLKTNPAEEVFARSWRALATTQHILEYLLCASPDQQLQLRNITQREATCAATLMQWLGSPVGRGWLEETLKEAKARAK